jgi:hypothetical protein
VDLSPFVLGSSGCSSIWLTAGTMPVSSKAASVAS